MSRATLCVHVLHGVRQRAVPQCVCVCLHRRQCWCGSCLVSCCPVTFVRRGSAVCHRDSRNPTRRPPATVPVRKDCWVPQGTVRVPSIGPILDAPDVLRCSHDLAWCQLRVCVSDVKARTAHPSMIEKLNELVPTAHMDKACGWTSHASQEKLKQDLMNGHERAACSVTPENSMLSSPERPQCATENQDSNRGVVDNVVNTLQRVRQASWTQDGPTCRQDCTKHRG